MYRDTAVSVAVPAHNEEDHISTVIETMPALVDHIIVVDDASVDRTGEIARTMEDPRVEVIRHDENRGVGGSILTAHRRGVELGAGVLVVMAGDAQMDPVYLTHLLDPLIDGEADFTKGNRFFAMDSFRGMPRHRVLGNVVLSFFTKLASGYWRMVDPQNGYTAITRQAIERIPLDRIADGYQFENDLLIFLNITRARVVDVPVPAKYGNEVSGIRLRRVVPGILALLFKGFFRRVFWKYVLWSFHPAALFLFTGLALMGWGIGFGVWVLVHTLGPQSATTGTVLLSLVPMIVGVNLLISFLVLDIQEDGT